jgi:uncharacterized protein (DUF2384 family)
MSDELIKKAKVIEAQLNALAEERRRIGRDGLVLLRRLDSETAQLVSEIWNDDEDAVEWFTEPVESLGWNTPWQCIADGNLGEVQRILGSIIHGLPA